MSFCAVHFIVFAVVLVFVCGVGMCSVPYSGLKCWSVQCCLVQFWFVQCTVLCFEVLVCSVLFGSMLVCAVHCIVFCSFYR